MAFLIFFFDWNLKAGGTFSNLLGRVSVSEPRIEIDPVNIILTKLTKYVPGKFERSYFNLDADIGSKHSK